MSLDIERVLSDGLDRVLTQPGAVLVVAFLALGFANTVVVQSLMAAAVEFTVDEFGPRLAETGQLEEFRNQVGALPFAVSLPPVLLGVAFVALAVVAEGVSIVAVRLFAAADTERWPDGVSDRLLLATVNGFLAGVLAFVVVLVGFLVGLVGLIIGSVVVAAFLGVSLIFVRQAVALDDENAIGALSESWAVAEGNRWELFGLMVVLAVIGVVIGGVGGAVGGALGPTVSIVVNVVVGAIVGVFGIAVTTRAYEQLRAEREGAGGDTDGGAEAGSEYDADDVY